MEFTLTATIFSFFGWNVYLLIKKYRERQRQNYLQNLIDQESDYLIMNVAPYKKIKVNEDKQTIIKPIQMEEAESSSDDFELISYRRRKTILEEVKQEKFQEQTYIDNIKSFDMLPVPSRKDRKLNKSNKDFSFTSQNQEVQEVKRFRKNSKINIDDSLPIDSPKQINQNSSNKVSEKKITQFEFSNLKDLPENQDSKQESDNCIKSLITQADLIQNTQVLAENKNSSLLFPVQVQNSNEQLKEQNNQQLGVPENIFGKLIFQLKPQVQQEQQQIQSSPQNLKLQSPQQNQNGLFSNFLKTNNTNDLVSLQQNQIPQVQMINNLQQQQQQQQPELLQSQQPQQEKQEQQQISLFQNITQTNKTQIPDFSLDNQNKDSIINDSNVIQNLLPTNFTFGVNSSNQSVSKGGLFDSLINKNTVQFGNPTTISNITQDETSNKQNLFLQPSQSIQNNVIQSQPNMGNSLFGNIFSTQQPKEQIQQSQTGSLFNFSSNTQTGCNLFSNQQKN